MKATTIRRLCAAVVLAVAPFALSGCEDKEAKAEIERLNLELESALDELDVARIDYQNLEEEMDKLEEELSEERMNAKNFEADLITAKRDLERMQERQKREEERAAVAATRPASKETREKIKSEVETKLGVMAEIKGDQSSGPGFVVEADEKVWVYFAASTLAGNSKLEIIRPDGEKLEKFGAFEVSADADLARLELLEPPEEKLTPGEAIELKRGVSLLGVSDVGVLTEGRCYEDTPKELKADSRIASCPPGTPVFHGEAGTLLGVVTDSVEEAKKRELWPREGYTSRARRAIYRLDREVEWTALPITTFIGEARAIADADRLTRLVHAFVAVRPSGNSLTIDASTPGGSTKKIFGENRSVSAVRSLFELEEWLKEKGERASDADAKKRLKGPFTEMGRTSRAQTREFEARKFSPFHEAAAKQSLEWRQEAEKSLADLVKGIDE